MRKWPNLFIVGAPKTGTTSLHHYLKAHPQIFMSTMKEPNYFSQNFVSTKNPNITIRDTNIYLSLFHKVKDEKFVGESSVSYLSIPEVSQIISKKIPNARIIISLRDPVERMFSAYLMHQKINNLNPIFYEEIKNEMEHFDENIYPRLLRNGLYYDDVKNYLDTFGKKQVKILIFENWIKNPKNVIQEICEFLNVKNSLKNFEAESYNKYIPTIPRGTLGQFILKKGIEHNKITKILPSSAKQFVANNILSKPITKLKMTINERNMLINFYQKDVKKLEKLLDCKLLWPNFKD